MTIKLNSQETTVEQLKQQIGEKNQTCEALNVKNADLETKFENLKTNTKLQKDNLKNTQEEKSNLEKEIEELKADLIRKEQVIY